MVEMNGNTEIPRKAIIGNANGSFWLYDSRTGYDLTHPPTPSSPTVKNAVCIQTVKLPITVDPAKSALVVVDMQNYFLSTAMGRSADSTGLAAQEQLLQYAIPAARKAGIRIVWLNWGLTDEDLEKMPPATHRGFGFETVPVSQFEKYADARSKQQKAVICPSAEGLAEVEADGNTFHIQMNARVPTIHRGLGNQIGPVTLEDGSTVEGGRHLFRDQWNTQLTPELSQAYREGLKSNPADVWIHKDRLSGMWGEKTECSKFLDGHGIRTLFFAGVNTDQCVGGSLTDAYMKGYDCILLKDGAATSSPESCQQAYEFNAAGTYGFCTSCRDLWEGVNGQTSA